MATDDTALNDTEKSSIEGIATAVRQKMYGKDVRESIASGLELVGNVVNKVAQQAASSLNYEYFQDGPQPRGGTTVSQTVWNGLTWIQFKGDTTTQYKGLSRSIPYSNFPDFFGYPAKIEFDFQSSVNQQFDLRIDFFDANGNTLKSDLIKSIYFNIWDYRHITALYFAEKIDNVSLIKISLVAISNNIGKCLIKNATCTSVYHGEEELTNLIEGKSAFPRTGTTLDNTNYLGRSWLKVTGANTTQYKGVSFKVKFADYPNFEFWYEPLIFKFLAQSSIDTTNDSVEWVINIGYRNSDGTILGTDSLKQVNFKQWKYQEVQVNFQLNGQYRSQAAYFEVQLVSNDTKDIGSLLVADVSLGYNFESDDSVEIENDGLPHIYLNGDTSSMTKDNKVVLRFDFANFDNHVTGYAQTCWQGDSSTRWPKKAYRIKTYTDSALKNKLNFQPSHRWTAGNKWNLKAYYTDGLLCRDVANANIGAAIEATSTSNPENLITTDNFGFIDGFPVSVYINGKFQGIFSFNIAKGVYGDTKAIIDGAKYTNVTKFESYPTGGDTLDGTNFEMVAPDAPTDNIKNSFNKMLNFAINSNDKDFVTGIDKYLDKGSVIDYLIFSNIIGNTDAWGKNQTFFSYDLAKWYLHPYDLDVSFGGEWNGTLNSKPTRILGVDSLAHQLFVRFTKLLPNEIKARYQSLRTWLTPAYVLNEYRKRIDSIGDGNYQREYDKWSNPSKDTYTWPQLSDYVVNQFKICDAAWLQS